MLLDVQLLGFEHETNLRTSKTDDGGIKYCCCEGSPCRNESSAPKLQKCPPICDVFFNVKLSVCQYPSACSITTINEPIINSSSVSSIGYNFSFILSNIPPQVSHCSVMYVYLVHHICMWQMPACLCTCIHAFINYVVCMSLYYREKSFCKT